MIALMAYAIIQLKLFNFKLKYPKVIHGNFKLRERFQYAALFRNTSVSSRAMREYCPMNKDTKY